MYLRTNAVFVRAVAAACLLPKNITAGCFPTVGAGRPVPVRDAFHRRVRPSGREGAGRCGSAP